MSGVYRRVMGAAGLTSMYGLLLVAAPAGAQTVGPAPAGPSADSFSKADATEAAEAAKDEILVTAHQQHGAVATDIPPQVTINSAAISALGAADLNEVFELFAPEFRNGQSAPGKAGDTPIVLVNGQRIAGFAAIKDLPPEAIRRIEVYPEKVALQYGYDATQKVVNVVLRSNYHALTLLGRYTAAPENWRGVYRAKADLLRIGENAHWNIDLDYAHQDPIYSPTTLAAPGSAADAAIPAHTLATQSDDLTISGDATRQLGGLTAELAGRLDLHALQSRLGLSDDDGDLLVAQGSPDLISGPRYRSDRTVDAQTSLTLNGKLDEWRWSFVGKLDDTTRAIHTLDGPGQFDTIQLPSPGMIADHCDGPYDAACVVTDQRTAGGDFYLNGRLFALPAGSASASFRTGFAFSGIRSEAPGAGEYQTRNRDEANVQANLDLPVTTARSAIGKLTIGINGEARRLSDFGTLTTVGSSLQWTPIKPVEIVASVRRDDQAPDLQQLAQGLLVTPDLREFDFVTGQTSIVQQTVGGNTALDRQRSRIADIRAQITPVANLQLSAEYTIEHTRDPIFSVTAATAQTEAAFPDLFTRNADGYLTAVDDRPVNLYSRDQQRIRWGLNYSTAFGPANPAPGRDGKPLARDQFQIALYDTWRLQDDARLQEGSPRLSLLDGDFISDTGGTPRHELELQTTIATRTWSADINARWQAPTHVMAGPLADEALSFSQGVTLDLRFQINMTEIGWLSRALPFLRGKLNISADNILGAHATVHDAHGVVPSAYSESYINPTGRTFRITLRKRFH
ncbi:hypothetical protein [Sphingomonas oryzagri]